MSERKARTALKTKPLPLLVVDDVPLRKTPGEIIGRLRNVFEVNKEPGLSPAKQNELSQKGTLQYLREIFMAVTHKQTLAVDYAVFCTFNSDEEDVHSLTPYQLNRIEEFIVRRRTTEKNYKHLDQFKDTLIWSALCGLGALAVEQRASDYPPNDTIDLLQVGIAQLKKHSFHKSMINFYQTWYDQLQQPHVLDAVAKSIDVDIAPLMIFIVSLNRMEQRATVHHGIEKIFKYYKNKTRAHTPAPIDDLESAGEICTEDPYKDLAENMGTLSDLQEGAIAVIRQLTNAIIYNIIPPLQLRAFSLLTFHHTTNREKIIVRLEKDLTEIRENCFTDHHENTYGRLMWIALTTLGCLQDYAENAQHALNAGTMKRYICPITTGIDVLKSMHQKGRLDEKVVNYVEGWHVINERAGKYLIDFVSPPKPETAPRVSHRRRHPGYFNPHLHTKGKGD